MAPPVSFVARTCTTGGTLWNTRVDTVNREAYLPVTNVSCTRRNRLMEGTVDGVAVMQKAQNTALRQWLAGLMQKGMSQRELARRLNVSASKLNRFVCGVQDKFYVGAHDLETAAVMFSSPPCPPRSRCTSA